MARMTGSDVIWQSAEKRRRTPMLALVVLAVAAAIVVALAGRAFWSVGGFREKGAPLDTETAPAVAPGKPAEKSLPRRSESAIGSSVAPRANPAPRDSAPPRHAPLPRSD